MPASRRVFIALFAFAACSLAQTGVSVVRPGLAQRQIQEIAFLPDNRTLVTADGNGVTLWDTQTGLARRTSTGDTAAKVAPGGRFFWSERRNPLAMLSRISVDDPDGPKIFVNTTKTDVVLADALDSMLLYRDRNSGQVMLSETPTSAPANRVADWTALPSGRGYWDTAKFNPTGSTVAIADFDGKFQLYDYTAKRVLFTSGEAGAAGYVFTKMAFSPDGKLVATVAQPGGCVRDLQVTGHNLNGPSASCNFRSAIAVRDAASGRVVYSNSMEQTLGIGFTADSGTLAVASGQSIRLVNLASKAVTRTLALTLDRSSLAPGQSMSVRLAFSPDGNWLAETSHGPIYLFDLASGHVVRSMADPPLAHIANSILTRDDRLLAVLNMPDRVIVTELSPGVSSRILKMNPVNGIIPAISADGSTLAAADADHKIHVWNIRRAEPMCEVAVAPGPGAPTDPWHRLDLSADGSELLIPSTAAQGEEQGVEIWDTRACRLAERIAPAAQRPADVRFATPSQLPANAARDLPRITRVALSPGGRFVAWTTRGNLLSIWNRAQHRMEAVIRVPVPAVFAEIDPGTRDVVNHHLRANGQRGALPGPEQDAAPDTLLRFEQIAGGVNGINFGPDDSRLATLDRNGQVRLWSTAGGRFVRTLDSIQAYSTYIVNGTLRSQFTFGSMAFSPDGHTAVSIFAERGRAIFWDLNDGKRLRPLRGFGLWTPAAAFTSDGKTVMALGWTSNMLAADAATGSPLVTVSLFGDGQEWLTHTSDGLFDGTPAAYRQLGWSFPGKNEPAVPIEAFFADFYRPGLLPDVLSGKRVAAARNLERVDRRQAAVHIEPPAGAQAGVAFSAARVKLRIRVTLPPTDESHPAPGALRDLRLFRNGSLVFIWRGGLKPGSDGVVEVSTDIPLVAGPNQIVAYGFNQDNVQTGKSLLVLDGAPSLSRKGIAYLVVVGVNQYENREFNLRYAAADATLMATKVSEQLKATHRYSEVRVVPLLDAAATKSKLVTALVQLSGGVIEAGNAAGLTRARPEDAVFLFFAGHGWARDGRFYLIPHDLGYRGARARLAADPAAQKTILDHGISDRELAGLLENIDAGLIALVIDACNSGQMLESEEARQGPFNSKGLAQLAWDKGMYVLTAAQSYQAALEAQQLQHGYLTYALVEEGLTQRKADRDPEDGEIDIHEWFDYAASRVPEMQRERAAQARLLVQPAAREQDVQMPRAFYRYELGKHLSIGGLRPAGAVPCEREAELKPGSGVAASLTFENTGSSSARKVYWLDEAGNRQFFSTLAPGGIYTVNTSTGHSWVVTDTTDQCVAIYTASSRRETALIEK